MWGLPVSHSPSPVNIQGHWRRFRAPHLVVCSTQDRKAEPEPIKPKPYKASRVDKTRKGPSKGRGGGWMKGVDRYRSGATTSDDTDDFVVIGQASVSTSVSDWEERQGVVYLEEDEDEGEDEGADEEAEDYQEVDDDDEGEVVETEEQKQLRAVYTTDKASKFHWGPLSVQVLKGKGRGVVTRETVSSGQLLMVDSPLAIMYCAEGVTPENEELAEHLTTKVRLTDRQARLLNSLAGPGEQPVTAPDPTQFDWERDAGCPRAPVSVPAERALQLVQANCYGEEFDDPVWCGLRRASSCGHLGLWPALSLINHSCCPNSIAWVMDDKIWVRAAGDIGSQEEVTLSYLGRSLTAPHKVRQAELQETYGFKCGCPRCRAEVKHCQPGSKLEKLMEDIFTYCGQWTEELEEVIAAGNQRAVRRVYEELEVWRRDFEALLKELKVSSKARRWLQVSVYDLYDLLSLCADELSPEVDTERLAECARVLGTVALGTDGYVDVAMEYAARTENKFGPDHQEARDAQKLCIQAHVARYGPVSDSLLRLMIQVRSEG